MPATCSRLSIWRGRPMQAASAFRSDLVCSAKRRKERPVGSVTSASEGASSAATMLLAQAGAVALHHADAEAADDRRAHALGMMHGEEGGDARAHGIAHHVGALDAEMIEQRAHVARHQRHLVGGGIVELARLRRGRDCRARSRGGRPASASPTQDGLTQLISLLEAKPCTSTIGSPLRRPGRNRRSRRRRCGSLAWRAAIAGRRADTTHALIPKHVRLTGINRFRTRSAPELRRQRRIALHLPAQAARLAVLQHAPGQRARPCS